MKQEKWEKLYTLATLEVDGKRVPDRIVAVSQAIRDRLKDLKQSSEHNAERKRMTTVLERLQALESESQDW
jgi:hypothetical protein